MKESDSMSEDIKEKIIEYETLNEIMREDNYRLFGAECGSNGERNGISADYVCICCGEKSSFWRIVRRNMCKECVKAEIDRRNRIRLRMYLDSDFQNPLDWLVRSYGFVVVRC
jgi:hypothetical protein